MTQTVTAINACDIHIELADAEGTYRDISGSSNQLTVDLAALLGSFGSFGGCWPGRLQCGRDLGLSLTAIYTTAVNEAVDLLKTWYFSGTCAATGRAVRFYVPDSGFGSDIYTATVFLVDLKWNAEAGVGDPIYMEASFLVNGTLTQGVYGGLGVLLGMATAGVYYGTIIQETTTLTSGWTPLVNGLVGVDRQIRYLAESQPHGNRAYVATEHYEIAGGNVWRNDNVSGGGTWTKLTLPNPAGYDWTDIRLRAVAICADPLLADTVYIAVSYRPDYVPIGNENAWLYYSSDAGETFTVSAAPSQNTIPSFSVCPTDTTQAYATGLKIGRPREYRVTDITTAAPTWTVLRSSGLPTFVMGIFDKACPDDEDHRYQYGTWPGNIYLARDGVKIFDVAVQITPYVGSVCIESNLKIRAVTGLSSFHFRGVEDGATQDFDRALPAVLHRTIHGETVNVGWYIVGGNAGIWATNDDGLTFTDLTGALPVDTVRFNRVLGIDTL